MSWLNLNDSLNSLKGQISNFANNVLAEEDERQGASGSNAEFEELQILCKKQQEEISYLQKLNSEISQRSNPSTLLKDESNESWGWQLSEVAAPEKAETPNVIADLKKTISQLQTEKQDLMSNLLLLDSEHQLSNEKLINMKNKLQKEYNELEDKYNVIRDENESLLEKLSKEQTELKDLKITLFEKNASISDETCIKCNAEKEKFTAEIEKLTSEINVLKHQKIVDDSQNLNEMNEKLKLFESENKILVSELKKATQSISEFQKKSAIDAEHCKKLAIILEGYEQQVSALKEEVLLKNSQNTEDDKLKHDLQEVRERLQSTILEKERTHVKYINILTENMKKYNDSDKSFENFEDEDNPQVVEFNNQVRSILNILLDLRTKCESLENELFSVSQEKTKMLSEKNHEIEKLIQNSEILSQEVITKSQTMKDYENECSELIKNNDMLINELNILKNNSGLQTISESNEDNVLFLESQLENANKKIEELEAIIAQKEFNLNEATVEDKYVIKEDFDHLKQQYSELEKEFQEYEESHLVISEENQTLLSSLEKFKTDLENTEYHNAELNVNMDALKEEVESLKKKIEELTAQKTALEKSNQELERNNEDIRSEFNIIREKLLLEEDEKKQCESQIRNLTEKLQNAKMNETSLKLQYDTISKELIGINEAKFISDSNLKESISAINRTTEELHELQKCNENLKIVITELENKLECEEKKGVENAEIIKDFENINLLENSDDLTERFNELKLFSDSVVEEKNALKSENEQLIESLNEHSNCRKKIDALEAAKHELTNVIITKHQENVTYHNEIQRLTQILNSEVDKNRNLDTLLQNTKLEITEIQKKSDEIEKLSDQNSFLKQKCEVLAQNLLEEQSRVQKILAEQSSCSEKEQGLAKKLERLQSHLIEVEEHYTQELLRAEERNTTLQVKVNEIEQREKNSSTIYTSVSIRANQHVETLQHQLQLITNQRDELRKKMSDAEDHSRKQEAALTNLQFVLEQFQKDKEKDVQKETERIRRQITAEKKVQEELKGEIIGLHSQLEESKHGLLAASRLSDQLEQAKKVVTSLKTEVSQLKEKLAKNEDQLLNLSSQSDGKVDKSLIKNLVIGFVSSNNNLNKDQTQILKIIATVLDFNQQDHDKIDLNKSHQGWLSSFLSPQSAGISQESLSQAFVKFLENESKPRLVPSLLNNNGEATKSRKSSTASGPRQSPSILSEMVLPTFADFAQNRNSSSILKDVLKDNS